MNVRTIANDFKPKNRNLNGVWRGYKFKGGQRTDDVGTVFSVKKKIPLDLVAADDRLPLEIDGGPTDVIEVPLFEAPRPILPRVVDVESQAGTGRARPFRGGSSGGHHSITAGTNGGFVKWGPSGDWFLLTNAHVGAPHWSTAVKVGDHYLQPGPHDQGIDPVDQVATLAEWAEITMRGASVPGKKNTMIAKAWWNSVRALGNAGARATRCPFRMRVGPRYLEQPWGKNHVDASLQKLLDQDLIIPEIEGIGQPQNFGVAPLGGLTNKLGRTTLLTPLICTGVEGVVDVGYGGSNVAEFEDQDIYTHRDGVSAGSAGGDSGSWIVSDDGSELWSLLFAGGPQQGGPDITIANKISDVVAVFGQGMRLT